MLHYRREMLFQDGNILLKRKNVAVVWSEKNLRPGQIICGGRPVLEEISTDVARSVYHSEPPAYGLRCYLVIAREWIQVYRYLNFPLSVC